MFDFRYYIDLLLEDAQMIAKIRNQADFKKQEGLLTDNQYQEIKHVLDIVSSVLKKNNRIIWFLRIVEDYVNNVLDSTRLGTYRLTSLVSLLDKFAEYYNPNNSIDPIEKYSFNSQTVSDVLTFFQQEKEKAIAKQEEDRGVDPQEGDYILFKFQGTKAIPNDGSKKFDELPFKYAWWWINRAYCPEEGRSGEHCGNIAGQHNPDQRILSFRDNQNRVQMTFILEPDNTLGEMRANYNQKPNSKFHPYIMPLLMWDRVEGLTGAPYGEESAFNIFDLNEQQLNYLEQNKPKLIQDQVQVSPINLLRAPNSIKQNQKYLKLVATKIPAIKHLLIDNSLESWTKAINEDKQLLIYLPVEYYNSFPDFKNRLLRYLAPYEHDYDGDDDDHRFDYHDFDENDNISYFVNLPKELKKDVEFVEELTRRDPFTLKFVSPHIKGYQTLVKNAINRSWQSIKLIPDQHKTEELCKLAFSKNSNALFEIPEEIKLKYPKWSEIAVSQEGIALKTVPDQLKTKEICKLAVLNDGRALAYVPNVIKLKHLELNKIAVSQNGMALYFVPIEVRTEELCILALQNADSFDSKQYILKTFVPPELRDKLMRNISQY